MASSSPEKVPVQSELRRAAALLEELGVEDVEHPSGTLMEHLQGTYDLLAGWGCPPHVCVAGLYHSVYGTEFFEKQTLGLDARERVKAAAGDAAEELVFLYCVIRRRSLYDNLERGGPYTVETRSGKVLPLTGVEQFSELLTLDLANRIEQLDENPLGSLELEQERRTYERAVPVLTQEAVRSLRSVFPHRSRLELAARRIVRSGRRLVRR
jgi:hypothetical protein